MDVPAPIADFFEKKERNDAALWSLFTDDATVIDAGEGQTMRGSEEIKKWIGKSIAGLHLHTETSNL